MEQLNYRGLTEEQIRISRAEHGANVLPAPVRVAWYIQYLQKFRDPVIRILMIAAVLSCLIGDWVEGGGILAAILLATFIAFLNEYRAEKEFDLLNQSNDDLPYKVIRGGAFVMVPRRDLVVGDVIFIEQGEEIPADARVLEAVNLQLDESSLTGETDPVGKFPAGHPEIARLGECTYPADKLMRGTPVVEGYGYAEITAVGEHTEIGRTAREASLETEEDTPLQKQLEKLSRLIGLVGFLISVLTFGVLAGREIYRGEMVQTPAQWGITATLALALALALLRVWLPLITEGLEVIRNRTFASAPRSWICIAAAVAVVLIGLGGIWFGGVWQEPAISREVIARLLNFFMIAVTLIVVAVPEGLAMSVTLSLAYSMRRMTASNNLVRKMHACETIGAATVICTDKTGTLTMNRMRVNSMHFAAFPEGSGALLEESIAVNTTGNLSIGEDGEAEAVGNPTEGALLLYLHGKGLDFGQLRFRFQLKEQLTFSTERKFMATYGRSAVDDRMVLYVKGAPEILLGRCAKRLSAAGVEEELTAGLRRELEEELHSWQARGMRTLAICYRRVELGEGADLAEEAKELVWMGFAAISDPVRPEVPPAVACCRRAGIRVKVVTGDSPETAREIGRQIGLAGDGDFAPGEIITGREYAALDDEEAVKAGQKLKIMARARPEDKLRLVRSLKRSGEVVAVTGDGTNDAPALNNADVGIAMGKTGTAIAKEAAAIILLDDSFASVVNAVLWGRSLYANIQRFIIFQLTINVTALSIAVIGPFVGVELPLTVIQMLWINLIMDTFAALALATEPPDPSVMDRPPRRNSDFIVTPGMARWIFGTGIVQVVFFLLALFRMQGHTGMVALREQTLFFSVFVMIQFWNLFNVRAYGSGKGFFARFCGNGMFYAIAGAILVGQIVIVTCGGKAFRVVPLGLIDWVGIIAGCSIVFWAGEGLRVLGRLGKRK